MKAPLIIYHANCTDGFTTAWVTARALGDAELHAAFYGETLPDVADRDVYVLDFAYDGPGMDAIAFTCASAGKQFIALDHHKTTVDLFAWLRLRWPQFAETLVHDLQCSGARLAYDYFVEPERPGNHARIYVAQDNQAIVLGAEWLVDYVQDRDLWRWALRDSRFISAGIECVRKTLPDWDALASRSPSAVADDGIIIEAYRKICITAAAELARLFKIGDQRVPAANTSEMRFASDTAHALAEGYPFAATYWVRADGIVQFSLRSREDGADVSVIAKGYGGGGHAHAAGFQVDRHLFETMLEDSGAVTK